MLTLVEAIKIVKRYIPKEQTLYNSYGEAQGKYVFNGQFPDGCIPPGGFNWTVDKETGECKCEYLERERVHPMAKIRGYKKLTLEEEYQS